MTFRNPLLLAGLAAAVLPLVLHLVQRARARGVEWGAMPLLASAAGGRAAGSALRHAAVLTLRVAAVTVLAVMLARPTRSSDAAGSATDPASAASASTAVVLVVDGSPSMLHAEADTTRFELARRAALDRLGRLSRGDQAGLIELGVAPAADVTLSPDLQAVASQLASMTPGTGLADQADGARRARDMLTAAGVDGGEIDLIGDRQRSAWAGLSTAVTGPDGGPRVVAFPVGSTRDQNVVVESVTPLDPPAIVGVPAAFGVRVRNDGPLPQGAVRLRLSARRAAATDGQIAVAAGGWTEVVRTLTFDRPGSAVVSAAIEDAGFPADNTAACAVDVIDRPAVVVLNTAAGLTPPIPPTSPATLPAAWPDDFGPAIDGRAFAVTTAAVLPAAALGVVVLAAAADDATVTAVEHYVADGGAVLLSPPPGATAAAWDRQFWKGGFGLSPVADDAVRAGGRIAPHAALTKAATDFDAFAVTAVDFTAVDVRRRFGLARLPADTVLADVNGEPLVIERAFGRGRVIVVATPLDGSGTARPAPDTFGGLTDTLLRRLCVRGPDRNVDAGSPIEFTARLPRDRNAYVLRPDGGFDRVPVLAAGTGALVRYPRTDAPGRYVIRVGEQTPLEWVVRNDPAESDLSLLDDAALAGIVRTAGVELYAAGAAGAASRVLDTTSLLAVTLVVMLAGEAWLATAGAGS